MDSKLMEGISRRSICGRPLTIIIPSIGPLWMEGDAVPVLWRFACSVTIINSSLFYKYKPREIIPYYRGKRKPISFNWNVSASFG